MAYPVPAGFEPDRDNRVRKPLWWVVLLYALLIAFVGYKDQSRKSHPAKPAATQPGVGR